MIDTSKLNSSCTRIEVLSKKRMSPFNKKLRKKRTVKEWFLSHIGKLFSACPKPLWADTAFGCTAWRTGSPSTSSPSFPFFLPHEEHYLCVFPVVTAYPPVCFIASHLLLLQTYISFTQIFFFLLPNYIMNFSLSRLVTSTKMAQITYEGHKNTLMTHSSEKREP